MIRNATLIRALLLSAAVVTTADAKIVRIAIDKTEPVDGGYERMTGTAIGELDPADAQNEPRRSLEERYGYACVVRKAATRAVATGFLLPVDAQRLLAQADAANVLPDAGSDELRKIEDAACK